MFVSAPDIFLFCLISSIFSDRRLGLLFWNHTSFFVLSAPQEFVPDPIVFPVFINDICFWYLPLAALFILAESTCWYRALISALVFFYHPGQILNRLFQDPSHTDLWQLYFIPLYPLLALMRCYIFWSPSSSIFSSLNKFLNWRPRFFSHQSLAKQLCFLMAQKSLISEFS